MRSTIRVKVLNGLRVEVDGQMEDWAVGEIHNVAPELARRFVQDRQVLALEDLPPVPSEGPSRRDPRLRIGRDDA